MKVFKKITVMTVGLVLLMVFTTASARAERVYVYSPLFLPFAVAGAAVGTAGAIVTGVVPGPHYVYPADSGRVYYEPVAEYHSPEPVPYGAVWVPGYYDRFGDWIPGHWR